MKYISFLLCLIILTALLSCGENPLEHISDYENDNDGVYEDDVIAIGNSPNSFYLPEPAITGEMSIEEALASRRSRRSFQGEALSVEDLSQILWAAYGVTEPGRGLRTAPSAGATYPLEVYVVIGNVSEFDAGVYKYDPFEHRITETKTGDVRNELSAAALNQTMIREAPITIVYTAVFSRIEGRYGQRGRERYVFMEIGHSAQNIYLQAEALGLGTCAIGAFSDSSVRDILEIPADEDPLYFLPVGHVR